ncbi:MAG: copper chaperone PCu(A)C, partial [Frankia sp.]
SAPSARASSAAGDGMPAAIPGTGRADLGDLHIRGAYIPQEASPDVAAAYFSVTNDGSVADQLVAVTTPAAPTVGIHTTVTSGGTETMEQLRSLAVPAGGTALLSVGGRHLMLMNPVHLLREGERVAMTMRFARAGTVTMTVPVVGFTGPADMAGMTDMPGMTDPPSSAG